MSDMRHLATLLALTFGLILLANAGPLDQTPSIPQEKCPWDDTMTRPYAVNRLIAKAVPTCGTVATPPTQAEVEAILKDEFTEAAEKTFGCEKCTVDTVQYVCAATSTVTIATSGFTVTPVLTAQGGQQCFSKQIAENYKTSLNNQGVGGGGWVLTDINGDDLNASSFYKLFRVTTNGLATTVRKCVCPE